MLRILILLIALLGTVTSLICLSCDDVTKCSSPFTTNCPNTQVCYTVKKNEQVVVRGCAESCDHVPITPGSSCESCNQRDFCNGKEQGIGYNVDREHHRVVNGSVEITNDTVVDVKTYIGNSAVREPEDKPWSFWPWCWFSGSSAATTSLLYLIAVPLIFHILQ